MAKKAAKQLAARNTAILNRALYVTAGVHAVYILSRIVIFRGSFTKNSLWLYLLLSAPALGVQVWFERISRPVLGSQPGEIRKSGEDLEAPGLTEYMWDVTYWTYACLILAAFVGDRGWWAYIAVPIYSAYAAYAAVTGVRSSLSGLAGPAVEGDLADTASSTSKRQAKLEKRGGQRVQYR